MSQNPPKADYFNDEYLEEAKLFVAKYDNGHMQNIIEQIDELQILNDNFTEEEIQHNIKCLKNGNLQAWTCCRISQSSRQHNN